MGIFGGIRRSSLESAKRLDRDDETIVVQFGLRNVHELCGRPERRTDDIINRLLAFGRDDEDPAECEIGERTCGGFRFLFGLTGDGRRREIEKDRGPLFAWFELEIDVLTSGVRLDSPI